MTERQRTIEFLRGGTVDRPPFHPILMRWAANYAGVKYRDFCVDYRAKCHANLRCAEDFDIDWVTVLSDPWAEASAFGLKIEYPEDSLPVDAGGRLASPAAAAELRPFNPMDHARCVSRVQEIREYKRLAGDRYFIVGWVEGPVAEYGDLRGMTEGAMDLLDDPPAVHRAMDVILESAMAFAALQVQAGADCIGIGDAFCSQIGPALYREYALARETQLVEHIHRLGALAKLHICGNTAPILRDMLSTGADILDVDHLVPSMAPFAPLLGPGQAFSGKTDPVAVIQNASPREILAAVRDCETQAPGRCIVSAGCEITPGTSIENMRAFAAAMRPAAQ